MAHNEMGSRKRLYPMPVEPLYDHPLALTLPAAGFGILMRIALHWWATECEPLPIADHELRNIARAHAPTWRQWKSKVLQIMEDAMPALEAYYVLRTMRRTHLQRLSEKGNGVRRLKAMTAARREARDTAEAAPRKLRNVPKSVSQAVVNGTWAAD